MENNSLKRVVLGIFLIGLMSPYAAATNCVDSDGGIAPDVQGFLTYFGNPVWGLEVCNGQYEVLEQYCTAQDAPGLTPTNCQYGCSNGACNAPPLVCSDTDGGVDPDHYGTVTYGPDSYSDSCYDDEWVTEYLCYNNEPYYGSAYCTYGCYAGQCNPDNVAPSVSISVTQYGNQSNVYTVSAEASDDSGIYRIIIYQAQGYPQGHGPFSTTTCYSSTCSYTTGSNSNPYFVYAVATDASVNHNQATSDYVQFTLPW